MNWNSEEFSESKTIGLCSIAVHEAIKIQFAAEAFNLASHRIIIGK
jgi:hypothetical protein